MGNWSYNPTIGVITLFIGGRASSCTHVWQYLMSQAQETPKDPSETLDFHRTIDFRIPLHPPKTKMEHKDEGFQEDFPDQKGDFQVWC